MLVQNKGNAVRHIGAALFPGLTRLSPADAEAFLQASKYSQNQHLIRSKEIEVVDEAQPKKQRKVQEVSADEVKGALVSKEV
ncbi:hypothetical protein AWH48_12055 [Domibacillus aminovorans]|uniref:Uncharacterized protein n=1 Tax=Domibacillus aminovorans TaxID=29332 RepID=A0A177KJM2_9BACI|nr:hypothetical protein [Domibacillus aminovorans]OAH53085.1 hypothetical protein AWH48_12055 [Domibacillus aminovorans]